VAFALITTGCAREPQPGTPEGAAAGDRLMRSMNDSLAHAKTITFQTTERIEAIAQSGEKRTLHFKRKTAVRRPNALYFELRGDGDNGLHLEAFYRDGTLTLSDMTDRTWARTEVPGTIDEMLDDVMRRFRLPVPVGDVVSSSPADAIMGNSARGGLVGWVTIENTACAEMDYSDMVVGVKLWLPRSGPALPRRQEIRYKNAPVPLLTRLDFTNWRLDEPLTDSTFTFQPPANLRPVEFSDLVDRMVSRALPAEVQGVAPATK